MGRTSPSIIVAAALALAVSASLTGIVPAIDPTLPQPSGWRSATALLAAAPGTESKDPPAQHGFNLLVEGNPALGPLHDLLVKIRRTGADSLAITYLISTAGYRASTLTAGTRTPSDATLRLAIQEAHSNGMRVMLRPILDESTLPASQWRGSIQPYDRASWFASYGQLLSGWAALAEREGVEIFDVGSELNSMEDPPAWAALIADVRRTYDGLITYSSNFDSLNPAMYAPLDFVSVDGYWSLDAPVRPNSEQLVDAWQNPLAQMLAAAGGKQVVLTELGVVPQTGIHLHPSTWIRTGPVDLEAQRLYYAAACQALSSPLLGLYWWNVELPPLDSDFSPLDRPAEQAVRRCFDRAHQGSVAVSNW